MLSSPRFILSLTLCAVCLTACDEAKAPAPAAPAAPAASTPTASGADVVEPPAEPAAPSAPDAAEAGAADMLWTKEKLVEKYGEKYACGLMTPELVEEATGLDVSGWEQNAMTDSLCYYEKDEHTHIKVMFHLDRVERTRARRHEWFDKAYRSSTVPDAQAKGELVDAAEGEGAGAEAIAVASAELAIGSGRPEVLDGIGEAAAVEVMKNKYMKHPVPTLSFLESNVVMSVSVGMADDLERARELSQKLATGLAQAF